MVVLFILIQTTFGIGWISDGSRARARIREAGSKEKQVLRTLFPGGYVVPYEDMSASEGGRGGYQSWTEEF